MNRDWLWDRKISLKEAKKIFNNPEHKNFILLASLLLTRKNEPHQVFTEYIKPILFCKNWPRIKKVMREDKWNNQRIIFWQAIYEKLIEKYRKEGIKFRKRKKIIINDLCGKVGSQIRKIRKEQGLSQRTLAKKLGISQQLISRIEKGRENISLITLAGVLKALGRKVDINFK